MAEPGKSDSRRVKASVLMSMTVTSWPLRDAAPAPAAADDDGAHPLLLEPVRGTQAGAHRDPRLSAACHLAGDRLPPPPPPPPRRLRAGSRTAEAASLSLATSSDRSRVQSTSTTCTPTSAALVGRASWQASLTARMSVGPPLGPVTG